MSMEAALEALLERTLRRVLPEYLHAEAELLTLAEAGRVAKRAPKTVAGWVKEGLLQRYGTGRRPLVSRKELMELLQAPRAERATALTAEAQVRELMVERPKRRTG